MKNKGPEEQNWELRDLGRAIASFFEHREPSADAKVLGELTGKLARNAGEGSSYLTPDEVAGFTTDPKAFAAVGDEEECLPLVVTSSGRLYFRRHFEYENEVARALALRFARPAVDPGPEALEFFGQSLAQQVDEHQALAVGAAMRKDLLLLTGGPGTGKTRTIVVMLAALLQANPNLRIALAAPTGKAAFRMRQSVLQTMDDLDLTKEIRSSLIDCAEATTLHRLLGWQPGVDFCRNAKNPLPHDMVVLDEASMVDLPMMAKFCSALRDEAKLVLVGDADQLAPVQGGPVFNGLARAFSSNRFAKEDLSFLKAYSSVGVEADSDDILAGSLVSLAVSHRREGSPAAAVLGELCDAIRDGEGKRALDIVKDGGGGCISLFEGRNCDEVNSVIKREYRALSDAIDPLSALSALADFRILCAHNKGSYGVGLWNWKTEDLLSAKDGRPYPVVVGVNDYSVRLFNGDDGIIMGNRVYFAGEKGTNEVARSRLPGHLPGYATTIHRSQGSEYEKVMIVLPRKESQLLTRELLYVAASRAKREIILVGNPDSFLAAIESQDTLRSGVATLLEKELV